MRFRDLPNLHAASVAVLKNIISKTAFPLIRSSIENPSKPSEEYESKWIVVLFCGCVDSRASVQNLDPNIKSSCGLGRSGRSESPPRLCYLGDDWPNKFTNKLCFPTGKYLAKFIEIYINWQWISVANLLLLLPLWKGSLLPISIKKSLFFSFSRIAALNFHSDNTRIDVAQSDELVKWIN